MSVSLKQINFAETQTTKPDTDRMAKYNAIQRAEVEDCGKAQGVEVDNRTLAKKFLLGDEKYRGSGIKKP